MSRELTTNEVATFLEVDPSFVRRLVLDKRLSPTRKVGQTWLFAFNVVRSFRASWVRRPGPRTAREKARQAK